MDVEITVDALNAEVRTLIGDGIDLSEELDAAVGEMYVSCEDILQAATDHLWFWFVALELQLRIYPIQPLSWADLWHKRPSK